MGPSCSRDLRNKVLRSWGLKVLNLQGLATSRPHGLTTMKQWKDIRRALEKYPQHWIAQRYFQQVPLESAGERLYPCLGIYTIDGKVAGIYGRLSTNGLVDFRARDIAVLVDGPQPFAEAI